MYRHSGQSTSGSSSTRDQPISIRWLRRTLDGINAAWCRGWSPLYLLLNDRRLYRGSRDSTTVSNNPRLPVGLGISYERISNPRSASYDKGYYLYTTTITTTYASPVPSASPPVASRAFV